SVIEERMRRAPGLPARFATPFTSFEGLQQSVLGRPGASTGFFAERGDQEEWAVKGLLDRGSAVRGLGLSLQAAAQEAAPAASPGARYFQEKRIQARCER